MIHLLSLKGETFFLSSSVDATFKPKYKLLHLVCSLGKTLLYKRDKSGLLLLIWASLLPQWWQERILPPLWTTGYADPDRQERCHDFFGGEMSNYCHFSLICLVSKDLSVAAEPVALRLFQFSNGLQSDAALRSLVQVLNIKTVWRNRLIWFFVVGRRSKPLLHLSFKHEATTTSLIA